MITDLTQNDAKLLDNILSLIEYAYRLGVYHGSLSKDSSEIEEILSMPLAEKRFKLLRDSPKKPMPANKFCDVVTMWCGVIGAMYLRNFLRSDIKLYSFKTAILIIAFVYYRDGLKIGRQCLRVEAKAFLDSVAHGLVHINALTGKKRVKEVFFDEVKYRLGQLQDEVPSSGLNRLSLFMGNTWVKYMAK